MKKGSSSIPTLHKTYNWQASITEEKECFEMQAAKTIKDISIELLKESIWPKLNKTDNEDIVIWRKFPTSFPVPSQLHFFKFLSCFLFIWGVGVGYGGAVNFSSSWFFSFLQLCSNHLSLYFSSVKSLWYFFAFFIHNLIFR